MQTATNPQTGEKIMWNGSAWVPAGSAPAPQQLPRVLEGPPKEASPQTTEQRQNTLTNVAQGQQSLQMTPPKAAGDFIKDFNSDPAVQAYRTVLPQVIAATQAGHNGPGDISVVYGWAKAMDPTGSVRDQDVQLGQSASSPTQRAQFLVSKYHLNEGGQLPPQVRIGLIEEMRTKGRQLNLEYSDKYKQYQQLLQQAGIDPSILGPHEGDKYRAAEEQYVRSVNGPNQGPTDPSFVALNGGPTDATNPGTREFGGTSDPRVESMNPQQRAAYDAWFKATPNPTPEALNAFLPTIGVKTFDNAAQIIDAYKKSGQLGHDVTVQPDISDARGHGGFLEGADAAVRGAADTLSLGTADKLAAAGDTLFGGGTMQQNLQRQYAISDYDAQNNAGLRIGGQIAGGFALPVGEVSSVPNLAAKGAAYGAAYGAGSSRSLSDVPMNALLGGAAGAAVPLAMGGAGKAVSAIRGARGGGEIPPLVDPATGELNQPLDAMTSAQRLDAVRGAGIETPTPGMVGGRSARVLEQGFNNLPGSAGLMEDVNSAASGQLRRGMQNVAQKFGSAKTLNEGGAELQRGASERIERGKTVIGKAYNAIPISDGVPASLGNTRATLNELTSQFDSNPAIAKAMQSSKIKQFADAIGGQGGLSWKDLKALRTRIGEAIGERRFSEDTATSDLRHLYASLSEDMRDTAAAIGPQALRAFERANTLNRQNEQVIQGALTRILGKDGNLTPEKAAAAVQAMTRGGKASGDLKTLAQIKSATVKSGAWDEIASTLIHLGGQPAGSEGRAFQPDTFVRWYADMAEPARKMLFKPELRGELDKFVAVNQQLARLKGLGNSSNTTPTMIGSGVIGASGIIAVTNPMALLVPLGGGIANNLMARLWTSPKFVNLMTGYSKAAASGNQSAVRSQIGRIQKLATTNPELREGIEHLLRSIANDNAPAAGSAVASPDQGPEQQGQPQ